MTWRPPASPHDIARLQAQLSRDPHNPKYPNQAIKVSVFDPSRDPDETLVDFIGYLEHGLADVLAPLIDTDQIGLRCVKGTSLFPQTFFEFLCNQIQIYFICFIAAHWETFDVSKMGEWRIDVEIAVADHPAASTMELLDQAIAAFRKTIRGRVDHPTIVSRRRPVA